MRPLFLILLIPFVLIACSGQRIATDPDATLPGTELSIAEQVQALLRESQMALSPMKERKQLEAAALLLGEGRRDLVDQTLAEINIDELPLDLFAAYTQIQCRLHIQRGRYQDALTLLESPRLQMQLDALPLPNQIQLSLLKAEVFALVGSHIASAQQRIYINPLLSEEKQKDNREAIWESLMNVSRDDLAQYQTSQFSGEYQGWLELAVIAKDNQGDLDEQVSQLEKWQLDWPQHPANGQLPGGLELIKELAATRPLQVALLLPTTGKLAPLGKAVRDGFIAARYQAQLNKGVVPVLKIYDTESSDNFIALYQQAIDEGAQMIVGPLDKTRLSRLFDYGELPVPTLALNRVENYGAVPELLFQFGLAPEDEAIQIADIAFLEGRRNAYLITPQSAWGERVGGTFKQRWAALGGTTIAHSEYNKNAGYSKLIEEALDIADSKDRARQIQRIIGESIEKTPRRRQDIDMVLMLAKPSQARSLKPLLNYHYAGDIPVYGTSLLYNGYTDKRKDRDINGVRFTDMPWVLGKPSALHMQISSEFSDSQQYQRMYALGVDTYQLHPRLRQLQEMTNSRVYGLTGSLQLNEQREIVRRMLYAQIQRSVATVIPTATTTNNLNIDKEDDYVEERQN